MKKILLLIPFCILNLFCTFSQELELNWQKSYGGSYFEYSTIISKTIHNNMVLWGRTSSYDGDVPDSTKSADIWRLEIDTIGNILHSNIYGISAEDFCVDVCESNSGGNIVVSTNMDIGDIDIRYIDSDRLQIWEKNYGGSSVDVPSKVIQTLDENYLVVGITSSDDGDVKLNYGANDIWILKINQIGDTLWTKVIGGTDFDECHDIIALKDSSFILVGQTSSNDIAFSENKGGADMFIMNIDKNSKLLWTKTYGGTMHDYAFCALETDNSEFMVVGRTSSDNYDIDTAKGGVDGWITKFDLNGNLIWSKTYGGTKWDEFSHIERYLGNFFIVSGLTYSSDGDVLYNHGDADQWIVIIDENGNIKWSNCYGGTAYDDMSSIIVYRNNVYAYGKSSSNDSDITLNHGFYDYCLYNFTMLLSVRMIPSSICPGDSVTFSVENYSQYDSSFQFKWMKNDEILYGENDSVLVIKNFDSHDIGVYKCVAEDSSYSYTSNSIIAEFYYPIKYDTINICKGDTILINGRYVYEAYTNFDTIPIYNSCDSVYITQITLNRTDSTYDVVTACDSYKWIDGNTYASSTDSATYTLRNFMGCDSVVILDLTINKTTHSSISDTVCCSYTSPSGKIWTASDTYTDTIPNAVGCDSIITIDLTIDFFNSISSNLLLKSSIYPNPAEETITIDFEELNKSIQVEIFSMSGQLIKSEVFSNSKQISIELNIPKDIYLIIVTNEDEKSNLFKILKQ